MVSTIQVRVENNPYATMGEEEILAKLKCSREHCEEGKCHEADKVISDLRGKYELHGDYYRRCRSRHR
ncbi:MAG: hypothetical protein K2J04_09655 [Lachnospiraceae bacterium]|nr:hypothetical protein [Lachnospiraceae bacterium]